MKDFTSESISQAIKIIDDNPELVNGRKSIEYDLVHEGKSYPPILVLSEANKILGGHELKLSDFGNSTRKPFQILRELGFTINKKENSYFNQLNSFLQQAKTGNLGTINYLKQYVEFKVKVSFGQGVPARVPWIAFTDDYNTVQFGIYPVYLFYKSKNILILAYGVSETTPPLNKWDIDKAETVQDFFNRNQLGAPERYGNSYVFKSYDVSKELNREQIDSDLNQILEIYSNQTQNKSETPLINIMPLPKIDISKKEVQFDYNLLFDALLASNLIFSKKTCLRFVASLITKPFVILTGLSGSGKTKLAHAFAKWIAETDDQICIVPVGADWTNREPLLGFPNALDQGKYIFPDNGALSLIFEARKEENQQKPYFLILDEMNLSHVERYFADFLSTMESGEAIPLKSDNLNDLYEEDFPSKIKLPKNLFIVGTVNVDETTYMFSPKVLDRANVIEFRISETEIQQYLQNYKPINNKLLNGVGANMASSFVEMAKSPSYDLNNAQELKDKLIEFFKELQKLSSEFGYRTASEILRFASIVSQIEPSWQIDEILDAAVMQKLLPKVHGSRRKLEPVLKRLAEICFNDKVNIENALTQEDVNVLESLRFPISFEKIKRMHRGLIHNGFTSYAEA